MGWPGGPCPHGDRQAPGGRLALDAKDRVVRRDASQFLVWGFGINTLEEGTDLEFPALQVGTEHGRLIAVGQLEDTNPFAAGPYPQLGVGTRSDVSDPLCLPSWCNQVPLSLISKYVDRGGALTPAGPSAYSKNARAVDAEATPSEPPYEAVSDVHGKPAWPDVALLHRRSIQTFVSKGRMGGGRRSPGSYPRTPQAEPWRHHDSSMVPSATITRGNSGKQAPTFSHHCNAVKNDISSIKTIASSRERLPRNCTLAHQGDTEGSMTKLG